MTWRKWGLGLLTLSYPVVIYGARHFSPRVMALALVEPLALLRAGTSRAKCLLAER